MSEPQEHGSFTLFPVLPLELRRCIWQHCLPSNRFIRIDVLRTATHPCAQQHGPPGTVSFENWSPPATNKPPAPTDRLKPSTRFYSIMFLHSYYPSILFRVNQEAREVASDFYRIKLPFCPFQSGDGRYTSVLHLNPDHDIIQFDLGLPDDISKPWISCMTRCK
jgi:hypothetical protein